MSSIFDDAFAAFGYSPQQPSQVQGGAFGGLTFQPLGWGSPTAPAYGGSTNYLPGNNVGNSIQGTTLITPGANSSSSQGSGISTGIQGSTISAPAAVSNPNTANTNATSAAANAPQPALQAGSLADYFARAIIIILGFIFVAIGLNMLRPGTIPTPRIGAG